MCLPLVVSALLGATAPRLGRRLPPATAVRLLTAALLLAALATGFVLAVAGALVLGQVPVVAAVGHWSARALGAGVPVPTGVGALAAVVVCGLAGAALRRAVRGGSDLLRSALACRQLGAAGPAGLVVVPDEDPDAYALPGLTGRVVVTTAMLRALPAPERRVLLAHEAAHLRHRHHLWVQAAELAAAADPLLRPGARAVRAAVERWADEDAAAEVGDRALAARALARAALARSAARPRSAPAGALAATDGAVVDRARALLAGPPPPRRWLAGAVGAVLLATSAAVLVTGADTDARFDAAQSVYGSR